MLDQIIGPEHTNPIRSKTMSKRKQAKQQKIVDFDTLKQINLHAAGLDIGAAEIWACVPQGRDDQRVKCFKTFTVDLHALAD